MAGASRVRQGGVGKYYAYMSATQNNDIFYQGDQSLITRVQSAMNIRTFRRTSSA